MDPGEHQCFVRSIVGRDAKKRPNPALGIDSDRPKPLGVGGSTEYHGCHCPPREVLGVGAAEVRREERIAIHDDHGILWIIERSARFSEATAGSKKSRFAREPQRDTVGARGF